VRIAGVPVAEASYAPPASLAALFEVIADFPGLTVTGNAKDDAGRPGLGVSWTSPGRDKPITNTLVFDSETHAFLGMVGGGTVVDRAVVDQVEQRP
jgi:hypothetical protein